MEFEKTQDGTTLKVSLIGELDSMNTPELEEKLIKEIDGVKELIFDLEKLEYISSAGLRVLLQMQKTMKTQGSMVIRNTNEDVMDIFKVTGFSASNDRFMCRAASAAAVYVSLKTPSPWMCGIVCRSDGMGVFILSEMIRTV